jgi:hypothetical protein
MFFLSLSHPAENRADAIDVRGANLNALILAGVRLHLVAELRIHRSYDLTEGVELVDVLDAVTHGIPIDSGEGDAPDRHPYLAIRAQLPERIPIDLQRRVKARTPSIFGRDGFALLEKPVIEARLGAPH